MADTYLAVEDLVELTDFAFVQNKPTAVLDFYVQRAHVKAVSYGPFPTFASLAGDAERLAAFKSEMRIALFLVAESIALANPARPMDAAGITQERAGALNISRAEGGGRSGKPKVTNLVPEEAASIFLRWALGTDELLEVVRTDVFEPTHSYDVNDPHRKVLTREDLDDLSLELHPVPRGTGSPLLDPDQ